MFYDRAATQLSMFYEPFWPEMGLFRLLARNTDRLFPFVLTRGHRFRGEVGKLTVFVSGIDLEFGDLGGTPTQIQNGRPSGFAKGVSNTFAQKLMMVNETK